LIIGAVNPSASVAGVIGGLASGGYDLAVQYARNNGDLSKINYLELGGATAGGVLGGVTGAWVGGKIAKSAGKAGIIVANQFALPFAVLPPIAGGRWGQSTDPQSQSQPQPKIDS